ncbi:hypothetical protein RND81_11G067800 [Saponaria officinalis]|uniref:Aminotransferase-like plant mobile domain-containing protein n=1 Tax=Saponaria officinalis TaxID=3572 RepID=A0AAW1HHR6_SAPOF
MGMFDWVTPALGLTIKYCRDTVRPDVMDRGSKPSLVFPGFIMESWVLSHFPSLLPQGFAAPSTYPAVHSWVTCDRSTLRFDYDIVRRLLNDMTFEQAYDPEMVHQPPEFFDEVDYEYGGARRVVRLEDDVPTMVADYGMDSWSSRVKKVVGDINRSIWRKANRWQELAARRTRELCHSRAETERMRAERDEFERSLAGERRRRQEAEQQRVEAEQQRIEAERRSVELEREQTEYQRRQADYDRQRAEYERQLEDWRRMYPGHFMP